MDNDFESWTCRARWASLEREVTPGDRTQRAAFGNQQSGSLTCVRAEQDLALTELVVELPGTFSGEGVVPLSSGRLGVGSARGGEVRAFARVVGVGARRRERLVQLKRHEPVAAVEAGGDGLRAIVEDAD